jgi:hypothetical protein
MSVCSSGAQQFKRMKHLPEKHRFKLRAAEQAVLFHVFPAHLASGPAGAFFKDFQYQGYK